LGRRPAALELTAAQMIHHLVDRAAVFLNDPACRHIFTARSIALADDIDHCLSPLTSRRHSPCAGVDFYWFCHFCIYSKLVDPAVEHQRFFVEGSVQNFYRSRSADAQIFMRRTACPC
jgi:hypothetical protein